MRKPFLVFDFDRTIADTFSPSPSGVGVEEGCAFAVKEVFGNKILELYNTELGGLQNREPRELAEAIMHASTARDIPLPQGNLGEITKRLVDKKLDVITKGISPEWPPFFPGAKEFIQAALQDELPITFGIVSSGHHRFAEQFFSLHELPHPPLLVTSDTIRDRQQPKRPKFKPHTHGLAEWHKQALGHDATHVYDTGGSFLGRGKDKHRMMYVGDDPMKDGGLARNARIIYGFVPFADPTFVPNESLGQVLIPDFFMLAETLVRNRTLLENGGSFAEVFLGRQDPEIFPPLHENERPFQIWMEQYRTTGRREAF